MSSVSDIRDTKKIPLWGLLSRLLSAMPVRRTMSQAVMPIGIPHTGRAYPTTIFAPPVFREAIEAADIAYSADDETPADWCLWDFDEVDPPGDLRMLAAGGFVVAKASSPATRAVLDRITQDFDTRGLWRAQLAFEQLRIEAQPRDHEALKNWGIGSVWMIEVRVPDKARSNLEPGWVQATRRPPPASPPPDWWFPTRAEFVRALKKRVRTLLA